MCNVIHQKRDFALYERFIENIATLAILQISNVYHNTFQMVYCVMTNLQKILLAKIV
jgi:hypothetical protein